MDLEVLEELVEVIEGRKREPPEGSYVGRLMREGFGKIAEKVEEESEEFIDACKGDDREAITHEAADLLFHSLVLLAYKDVSLSEVLDELRSRRKP